MAQLAELARGDTLAEQFSDPVAATAHVRVRPVRTPARARERYIVSVIAGDAAAVVLSR